MKKALSISRRREQQQSVDLQRTAQALSQAKEAVERAPDAPDDLAALEEALRALWAISGRDVGEETLDHIFRNFCVGK